MCIGWSISAQAQAERSSCADCKRPIANTKVITSYKYKTVQRVQNVTRYKDVNRTNYQKHVKRIVNVTRIQPVTRVNVVTRVHNRTVFLHQTQNVAQTATLPTRTVMTGKTVQINHPTQHRNCKATSFQFSKAVARRQTAFDQPGGCDERCQLRQDALTRARLPSTRSTQNGKQDDVYCGGWNRILESVMLSGMAVTAADPSGLFGILKESMATGRTLLDPKADPTSNELIKAVVTEFESGEGRQAVRSQVQSRLRVAVTDMKCKSMAALREVSALLDSKAPGDAAGFRSWLHHIAENAAEATSEGGFMGFGGTQVSDAEKATLGRAFERARHPGLGSKVSTRGRSALTPVWLDLLRISRVASLCLCLPGVCPALAVLQIGGAIDESGLQVAIVAAVFVSHVFERCFRLLGCV
jgi:hypothetical protein